MKSIAQRLLEKRASYRLERKRLLAHRERCHGSVYSCSKVHPVLRPAFAGPMVMPFPERRQGSLWSRFINWLTNLWN